jgi:hypothetical protein
MPIQVAPVLVTAAASACNPRHVPGDRTRPMVLTTGARVGRNEIVGPLGAALTVPVAFCLFWVYIQAAW